MTNFGGTLILDVDTILDAPKFFSILALVERAAGRKIIVLDSVPGGRPDGEKMVATLGIPLQEYIPLPIGAKHHEWKTQVVRKRTRPAIWIDLAFGAWQGPDLSHYRDIVILDWSRARTINPQPAQEV